jgi:DnaK suppressor protein
MEKELDQEAILQIKADLITKKEELIHDLQEIAKQDNHDADAIGTKFPEYGDKPDENAQEINDYSTNLMTEKVLEKTLEDVEGALKRIEDGSYGICKYCHTPISIKRLMARPVASACIACKTELQENE